MNIKIVVKGKVQGVFFRKHTQEKALELHLSGFVRNEPNGNVFIEASGPDAAVRELKNWCLIGSPKSSVTEVTCFASDFTHEGNFAIR